MSSKKAAIMILTPTDEQQDIITFAKTDQRSLLINALAGSAKTTTLVMLAHALPVQPVLCLAFNKRIAEEMQKRMPGHVKCQTLNSLGHGVWSRVIGKRLALDTSKNYTLLREAVDGLKGKEKGEAGEAFSSLLRGIALAKTAGFVPKSFRGIAASFITDDELYDVIAPAVDDEPTDLHLALIAQVLEKSIHQGYAGSIDFDDQIYLSTLFNGSFPRYPIVMVDEAQDLSPLNHATLRAMRPGRLVAVGDPWQSIYKFRGADQYSMQRLKETFQMEERTLSISFRCPISAVKRAHFRVPHMKWWETAIEGAITRFDQWRPDDVPLDSAILCRNNAPLLGCALRFIRAGRGVSVVGRDIGPGLIKLLKKLGPPTLDREATLVAIKAWEVESLAKAREERRASIVDRAECLRVFAEFGNSLDEAISYAEHLFSADGQTKLMTGHKAKGLEFDTVVHLDGWRIPSKWARIAAEAGDTGQLEQEWNLKYVIETRWKQRLILADLERLT